MTINRLGFQAVGFALAIAAGPLAGCAGNDGAPEPAPGGLSSQGKPELIGGEPVANDYFRTTVGIGNVCTAAKVGARLFLTAAHCVSLGRPGRHETPPEDYPPNEGVSNAYLAGQPLHINWGLEARDENQGDVTIVKT
ncbi:MAG TPA: hypothetical protein VFQ61_02380, partial [Polyangiaceae bacterium]|nr:hypothetical protein [Polyangiaceae bacterium]